MRVTIVRLLPLAILIMGILACGQGSTPTLVPTQGPTPTPFPLRAPGWTDFTVHTVCVNVDQTFVNAEDKEPEPIEEGILQILAGVGVQVVDDTGPCDADLSVVLSLEGVGADYTMKGHCYAGSHVRGEIHLSAPDRSPLTLNISGSVHNPLRIDICPSKPSSAPFRNAWREALIIGLAEIWGPQVLIQALKEGPGANIRETAAEYLGKVGPEEGVVTALIGALEDSDGLVSSAAAEALGEIGPEAADAAYALGECLKEKSWLLRQKSAQALQNIGPGALDAVPALIDALREWEINRNYAVDALRAITGQEFGNDPSTWQEWWDGQN